MIYPVISRGHQLIARNKPTADKFWIGTWRTTLRSPKPGNAIVDSLCTVMHPRLLPLIWILIQTAGIARMQQRRMFGPLVRFYRKRDEEPGLFVFRVYFGRWGYKGASLELSFKRSTAGCTLYVGSPTSEDDYRLHLGIPFCHLHLSIKGFAPTWLQPERSRRFTIDLHNYTLWWAFWTSGSFDYETDRAFPKWRKGSWNYADWLLGCLQQEKRIDSRHEGVLIGMPEGTYRAVVEMDTIKLRRPRWPWPVANFTYGNVEVPEGIPIPGKFGGDGATYSYHGPARSKAAAVAKFIQHVYEKRGVGGHEVDLKSELQY